MTHEHIIQAAAELRLEARRIRESAARIKALMGREYRPADFDTAIRVSETVAEKYDMAAEVMEARLEQPKDYVEKVA